MANYSDSQQGGNQGGGTMTQDPRWYCEQVRNSIAEKVQQKFSSTSSTQKNATPTEIVDAIRAVSLDDLVRDVQGRSGSTGGGGSHGQGK